MILKSVIFRLLRKTGFVCDARTDSTG